MENAENFRIVFITINTFTNAREISHTLLAEKLIACANIIPAITSIYEWDGKVEESGEFLMILKTSKTHIDQLENRIHELHPYDVPEIITVNLQEASAPYLAWLSSTVDKI